MQGQWHWSLCLSMDYNYFGIIMHIEKLKWMEKIAKILLVNRIHKKRSKVIVTTQQQDILYDYSEDINNIIF